MTDVPVDTSEPSWSFRIARSCLISFLLVFGFFLLVALTAPKRGIMHQRQNVFMQRSRMIDLAAFSYANDYDQKYPAGKSSTEICQKLLDGKYISDPAVFYIPLPGKVKPIAGQQLKPENVCWDFTVHRDHSGLDTSDSEAIPVVFVTGYRMNYASKGSALSLIKPYPKVEIEAGPWSRWWNGPRYKPLGLGVAYKNNAAKFLLPDDQGIVLHVISDDFDAGKRTYLQLTPKGPLP